MLSKSAINAAFPLAEALSNKGWALEPVADTPLSRLILASIGPALTMQGQQIDGVETPEFAQLLMDGSMAAGPDNLIEHDHVMQTSVAALSAVMLKNLDLARNTVAPTVKAVLEETKAHIESQALTSLTPYSIIPYRYKAIWNSPVLADLVRRYDTVQMTDLNLRPIEAQPSTESLDLVLTGAGAFDAEITQFVQECDPELVGRVWSQLFTLGGASRLSEVLSTASRLRSDEVLVAFLLARRAQEEVPEGVDMELGAWKAYVSTVMAQAGRAVLRIMQRREVDLRAGVLVFDFSEINGEIFVLADTYNSWLDKGNSPEVLFGAAIENQGFQLDKLSDADRLVKTWETAHRLMQSKLVFEKTGFLAEGLRRALTTVINGLTDEECVGSRNEYHERLNDMVSRLNARHLEDMYLICRKLVCRVIYPHTDAEALLEAVDAAAARHPELDLREAALLGTVDFVAGWACKLFKVETVYGFGK